MSERKFYKTVFTVTVLSETPIPPDADLSDVLRECEVGDFVGAVDLTGAETLDGPATAKALRELHSSPEFFSLDDDGNNMEDT